ncbi:Receptor-like protein kinase [Thalictrum thalictroides]|uniref:Receptor-like protein kinase n=1 Tax=Thalictrum thalictroides TaxID=46969 RepID=A0A7J6VMZ5_THATH|nr:Receptor-like protein kinase [Thalictrum thalictroides]
MTNSIELEDANSEVERFLSELGPKPYSYGDLEKFTFKFSIPIGYGGYGEVYKGQFPGAGGLHIAVKVLAKKDVVEETFMAEVRTMGKAYHRNLVKLFGYCFERDMKALVYEYMENGSLDKILYENHGGRIEWERLYGIAIETAKGIDYLHEGWDERIIHYDIKAGNVLLDKNLSPKITDFGLAKLMKRDVSRVPLSRIRGTVGYNAPETWMPSSEVTYKCDVYSFGMMLFEVLGRRRNGEGENWFPQQVWENYKNGQLDKIIKECGITEKDSENAKILSTVALWCAQYTPEIRPSMSDVVLMLQKKIPVGTPPYPFQFRQSLDSSVLPPTIEAIPEVNSEVLPTIDERVGEAKPSAFSLPVKTGGFLSYISKKMGKFGNKKGSQSHETESVSSSSPYTYQQAASEINNEKGSQFVETEKIVSKSQQAGSKNELVFFEGIRQFDLEDLLRASAEVVGKGSFGTKYKAALENGVVVCVNRLRIIQYEHKREVFEQYMEVLGNLRHNNVVSLRAYYFHRDEKLLVYDYMPNRSLSSLLHDKAGVGPTPVDWTARLKIAVGVAHGLDYIHHYSLQSPRLSHGNIKSTNVLIDPTFNPQLIDFDLSAFATLPITARPNGYRAPETLIKGRDFSHQKADIYAFGILLLEILTGKKPLMSFENGEYVDLPRWVQSVVREEWTSEVFDLELMNGGIVEEGMVMLLQIGVSCTSTLPDQRPSIDSVVRMIEEIGKPPYPFQFGQSSSFSMLPSMLEVLPKVNPEVDESVTALPAPAPVKDEEKMKQPAEDDFETTLKYFSETSSEVTEMKWEEEEPVEEEYDDLMKLMKARESEMMLKKSTDDLLKARVSELMLKKFEQKCPPGGENCVIIYTSTARAYMEHGCRAIYEMLESYQVKMSERNIYLNSDYRDELVKLLDHTVVPAVFVKGRFIGGDLEIRKMEQEGKLKILLDEKLLVYECMPNGSLFSLLHDKAGVGPAPVDWTALLKIAAGVASTFTITLSSRLDFRIMSTNVLIDPTFNPQLKDFDLSAHHDKTQWLPCS